MTFLFFVPVLLLVLSVAAPAQTPDRRTGVTLWQTGTNVSETYQYVSKKDLYEGSEEVSDPMNRELEAHRFFTNISYGVSKDITLSLSVPYVEKDLKRTRSGWRKKLGDSGPGDVSTLGKYRFFKEDYPDGTLRVAGIGGVQWPTGQDDETHGTDELLPPELQLGSGSVDPFVAVAASRVHRQTVFHGSVFYKRNTEGAQDFKAGDLLTVNLSANWRFFQEQFPGREATAGVGISWEHTSKAEQDGVEAPATGSDEVFLDVGIDFVPRPDVKLQAGVKIPFYHDMIGRQLVNDTVIQVSISTQF